MELSGSKGEFNDGCISLQITLSTCRGRGCCAGSSLLRLPGAVHAAHCGGLFCGAQALERRRSSCGAA